MPPLCVCFVCCVFSTNLENLSLFEVEQNIYLFRLSFFPHFEPTAFHTTPLHPRHHPCYLRVFSYFQHYFWLKVSYSYKLLNTRINETLLCLVYGGCNEDAPNLLRNIYPNLDHAAVRSWCDAYYFCCRYGVFIAQTTTTTGSDCYGWKLFIHTKPASRFSRVFHVDRFIEIEAIFFVRSPQARVVYLIIVSWLGLYSHRPPQSCSFPPMKNTRYINIHVKNILLDTR